MMKRLALLLAVICLALPTAAQAAFVTLEAACETSTDTTSGAGGALDLDGAHPDGYLSFATAGASNGDTFTCTLTNGSGSSRLIENGVCTYNTGSPNTVSRAPVATTTNGISSTGENFTSGTITICNTPIADYFVGGIANPIFSSVEVAGATAPTNGMYLISASALGLATNSTGRLRLGTTQFFPVTTDGIALGTTTNMFSDLFVADGAVINWNNGALTITATPSSLPYFQFDGSGAYAALNVDGGSSEGGKIRVQEADANGSNAAVFEAAASLASDKTCTLTSDTQMIPASCVNRTGEFFWWTTATCPSTYSLPTNGAAVSRTTYAELFAVISTTYGVGDGSTTFNVPDTDTDNRFIRAADGTTISISTTQTDAVESHTHSHDNNANRAAGGGQYTTSGGGGWSSGAMNSGTSDTETRPNNIALRGCIFY